MSITVKRGSLTVAAVVAVAGLVTAVTLVWPGSSAQAATATFPATADTYVQDSSPATNFGTSTQIVIDNTPVRRSFIKFTVSGLSGTVTSAKLRLHTVSTNSGSNNGGTYRLMTNTSWSETGVTWNNQPAIDGVTLGSLGSVSKSTWYEIDVTGKITGNGTYSIGGTSPSADGAYYDTRESAGNGPQLLIITSGGTPSPTNSPTSSPTASPTPSPTPTGSPSPDAVLVGAGDIATCSSSGDEATANLLDSIPGTVFTAGDNAYDSGSATEYANCYGPSWGRHKARTRPAPGNHEYNTAGATGYYGYFGAAAGDPAKGYYSYDLGNWHVIVINSNCSFVACGAGSAQEQWLRADLAASTKGCTIAMWHHPLFTSGSNHGPATNMRPIFQALYDFNADVVVNGHNHQYERFAPQNPTGGLDNTRGIREFVAGTGGASHYGFGTIQPNSQARNGDTFGVLKLTLHANSYDWQFVPEAGKTYSDSGSGTCH